MPRLATNHPRQLESFGTFVLRVYSGRDGRWRQGYYSGIGQRRLNQRES